MLFVRPILISVLMDHLMNRSRCLPGGSKPQQSHSFYLGPTYKRDKGMLWNEVSCHFSDQHLNPNILTYFIEYREYFNWSVVQWFCRISRPSCTRMLNFCYVEQAWKRFSSKWLIYLTFIREGSSNKQIYWSVDDKSSKSEELSDVALYPSNLLVHLYMFSIMVMT